MTDFAQMTDDLYHGHKAAVAEAVAAALAEGFPADEIVQRGLIAGMDLVGRNFAAGELFVPEVILAARAMQAGMDVLRPLWTEGGAPRVSTIVMGTVRGDLHDIGKRLVGMMLEGAGFRVVDLGTNITADRFIAAIQEHQAEMLGLSALLTTTMGYMKTVIDSLREAGLRDQVKVLVGGAPVTQAFADEIGADAYGTDAGDAVAKARACIGRKA